MASRWSDQNLELLESGTPTMKEHAAGLLRNLAVTNASHRRCIVEGGAVPLLVDLCRTGQPLAREHAAATLRSLAYNNLDYQKLLIREGCLPLFLELLQSGDEKLEEQAAGAFMYLASAHKETRYKVQETGAMPPLIALLRSDAAPVREQAAGALRMLVLRTEEHEKALVEGGGIPPLVDNLRSEYPTEQEHAAGCLKNMVVNNNPITERTIMGCGAAPRLIELLRIGEPEVQTQAADTLICLVDRMVENLVSAEPGRPEKGAEAIAYLAAISAPNRSAIMDEGAMKPLLTLLLLKYPEKPAPPVDPYARSKPAEPAEEEEEEEPELAALSEEARVWACKALRSLLADDDFECSDKSFADIAFIAVEEGVVDRLVPLLVCGQLQVQVHACAALRALLSSGSSFYEKLVLNAKALPMLVELITFDPEKPQQDPEVLEEAAALLAFLALNRDETRKKIAHAEATQPLVDLLESDCAAVHARAVEALRNIALNERLEEDIISRNALDICRRRAAARETEESIRQGCKALLKAFTGREE